MLVEGIGARTYLEFGTHENQTIGKVRCERRIGVDTKPLTDHPSSIGIQFFAMTTQQFIKTEAAKHSPYDVVFIDADHSRQAVEADFHGIWPYVSDEGLVLLHDTNPETEADTAPGLCGDAWKFAAFMDDDYQAVTLPYHPGLTIVRKLVQWGPIR